MFLMKMPAPSKRPDSNIFSSSLLIFDRILQVLSAKLRLEGTFNFTALAKATPGYVGADLSALTGAAGIIAVKRIFKQLSEGTLVLPEPVEAPEQPDQDVTMIIDPPLPTQAAQAQITPTSRRE